MHHQIGTEIGNRPLQCRRQEGVVHHHQRTGGMRGIDHVAQVGDAQQRVGRRLHPHQFRLAVQRFGKGLWIGQVAGDFLERALRRQGVEQAPATAIAIVRHQHALAGCQQRVDHYRNRAHPGGGHHAAGAAFQFGQGFAKQVAGRITAAGVVVGPLLAEAFETEIRRQHQRRRDRAEGGVAIDASAYRAGHSIAVRGRHGILACTHARSPLGARSRVLNWMFPAGPNSSVASSASTRSISFRKASCP